MTVNTNNYNKIVFLDKNVKRNDNIHRWTPLNICKSVVSIPDMVNALTTEANCQRKYNFIAICGHGMPGVQGLGCGRSAYTGGITNINGSDFTPISESLATLNQTIDKTKAIVFLVGCEVGSGDEGAGVILGLSRQMPNVIIVASEDALSFSQKKCGSLSTIDIVKVAKQRISNDPINFRFAYNGSLIKENKVRVMLGNIDVYYELTHYETRL